MMKYSKMKTHFSRLILIMSSLLIGACGGGGGGEEAPAPVAVTPPITPPVTPPVTPPTPPPTSLDDLVVDADNSMQASFNLQVSVSLANAQRSYLSLCDNYQATASGYKVNYESCLLRTPISSGKLEQTIDVPNHNHKLIGVIWHYDGQQPIYQLWQYQDDSEQQVLSITQ